MELLTPGIGLLFWTLIAFVIVFLLLRKFGWKTILEALQNREQEIADAIASTDKLKAEMGAIKNQNETLLMQAREESALLVKEARYAADKLVSDAKEKAKVEYDKILADAQQSIIQQKNMLLTEVKSQVSNMVVEVSEKILRRELANKQEQERLIQELSKEAKLN
ncbi:MAG: F0F1 ATP synthase subunit B [Phycisphaerales bacterium]|nr:F0F1 ATP synthase subunit B [Phycisphaerales bacterium]